MTRNELTKKASKNEIMTSFFEYQLSNSMPFCEWMLDSVDFPECECPENNYFLEKCDNEELSHMSTELDRFETFCDRLNITTEDDLIKLGDAGQLIGCDNAYDNIYRNARRVFKGETFREEFASSTLYYFWQNIVMGSGRLAVYTHHADGSEEVVPA